MSKTLLVELPEESYSELEEAARALGRTPGEVAALRLRLAGLPEQARQEALHRILVEAGLARDAEKPPFDEKAFAEWKPVAVMGKPVSETILEERR